MSNISDEGNERREAFRIDMEKELVDISWQDGHGHHKQKKIACLDFSRKGVKLDSDQNIPVNTIVKVKFNAASPNCQYIEGKVIRCIQQENGWFEVALRLDSGA